MSEKSRLTWLLESREKMSTVNSIKFFDTHWLIWKILGSAYKKVEYRMPYMSYVFVMNILITIGYPFHLGMALFRNANMVDNIKNLTTFATCFACSLKFLIFAWKFDKVARMEHLLQLLDGRVKGLEQLNIYDQMKRQQRLIMYVFIGIYVPCAIFAELAFLFQEQRGLMYVAWMPFDWQNSTRNYYIANVYQIGGVSYQLLQNFVSDCFPTVVLCLISAHTRMLYERFKQIGMNPLINAADTEKELEACITDHKNLMELFRTIESFMSLPMFIQFAVTALNVCISIAAVVFFITEPWGRLYFVFYALAMPLQIYPTCYFGTDNEFWLGKLHYAPFSCNWMTQRRSFKRKMILFVQCSLKKSTAIAGGMLRIHIDTFFGTLKFAYSLLTIILRMKK